MFSYNIQKIHLQNYKILVKIPSGKLIIIYQNNKIESIKSGRYLVVSKIFDLDCSNYEFYLIDYGYSKFNKKYTFWNNVHDF